jgi:hypothetical protein
MIHNLEQFFKPETRSAGERYFAQGKVKLGYVSDMRAQAFIAGMGATKINFQIESFDSGAVTANCNCSNSQKGQLCKHIWAASLAINKQNPEFLESRMSIEKKSTEAAKESPRAAAYKDKQKEYRKQQYQKQKLKKKQKDTGEQVFPEHVQYALEFFEMNGFKKEELTTIEDIQSAKKQLSRVFHPDKGGTHEEILDTNNYTKILLEFVETKGFIR